MKKVLFATSNASKLNRFKEGLLKNDIEIISLNDLNLDIPEPVENGENAIENALIKARYYHKVTNMPTLAMDDNLYIENIPDALQPGMYVRRVNGKRLNDEEMIEYYSNLAKTYGTEGKLTAKWIYGIAIMNENEEKTYTWSKEDFYMVAKPSEIINSGYPLNSISVSKKLNKYFTEITEKEKQEIQEDETHVIDFIKKNIE